MQFLGFQIGYFTWGKLVSCFFVFYCCLLTCVDCSYNSQRLLSIAMFSLPGPY